MNKLTAREGYWLTSLIDPNIYAKEVILADNDSEDNWKEISDEEYQELQAKLIQEMEERHRAIFENPLAIESEEIV